jgi:ATP-binding cassette subfamily B protein
MVGHRTRLAQLAPEQWHAGEDEALARAFTAARRLDRTLAWLRGSPRAWLPLFVLGLAPHFLAAPASLIPMAFAVGGALLGLRALRLFAEGIEKLGVARAAAVRLAPLLRAAGNAPPRGRPELALATPPAAPSALLLAARQLVHTYPGRARPALAGLDLEVRPGDRLLLGGASGGGKSTLARILAGAQAPEGGLVTLRGYDLATLGTSAWRQGVVLVPQFHEDHVLLGPLAFNVLLGRGSGAGPDDLPEAAALCEELGLGDLLARMPSGVQQTVGETGWQLSHGERARVCLARALVRRPAVLILDETFAALDPPTHERVMRCVLARQPTLVAIAHP